MKNPETIKEAQDLIMVFLNRNTGVSYEDLRNEFEAREGTYRRLIDTRMGPYDISVDVDLDEGFIRYSAILPWDENSRVFVDVAYETDNELLDDLRYKDYMPWLDSAIMHLKEAIGNE